MKKIWLSILALLMVLVFTACNLDGDPTINPDPVIFATDEDDDWDSIFNSKQTTNKRDPNQTGESESTSEYNPNNDPNYNPNEPGNPNDPNRPSGSPPNPGETSTRGSNNNDPSYYEEVPPGEDENPNNPAENTTKSSTPATPLAQPQGNAEIAAFYNNATKKVNRLLPTYKKTVQTTVDAVNGIEPLEDLVKSIPMASGIVNPRDEIGKNLGEGTKVYTSPRGEDRDYLLSGSLTANDLTGSSCVRNGDFYYITLNVKNSTNPEHNRGASISRFTTDYVSGSQARDKIENLVIVGIKLNATMESITMTTKGVQITAKINIYTGQPTKIQHKFGFDVEMVDVKGGAIGIKKEMPLITGAGHTLADYDNFLY